MQPPCYAIPMKTAAKITARAALYAIAAIAVLVGATLVATGAAVATIALLALKLAGVDLAPVAKILEGAGAKLRPAPPAPLPVEPEVVGFDPIEQAFGMPMGPHAPAPRAYPYGG